MPPMQQELWRPPRGQRESDQTPPCPACLATTGPLSPHQASPLLQEVHTQPPADTTVPLTPTPQLKFTPPAQAQMHTHTQGPTCTHAQVSMGCSHSLARARRPWPLLAGGTAQGHSQTHRPPEQTAAAESHRCRRGRPRSGSPCCEWPSCAPAWVSSRDSPGGHSGHPHGLQTLAAPSRAPRGARGQKDSGPAMLGQANHPLSNTTPSPGPAPVPCAPLPGWGLHTPPPPTGPSAGSRRKETRAWTFCES